MEEIEEIKLEILRHFDRQEARIEGTKARRLLYRNGKYVYVVYQKIGQKTIANLSLLEVGRWFKKITVLPHYHAPYDNIPRYGPLQFARYIFLISRLWLRRQFLNEDTNREINALKTEYVTERLIKGEPLYLEAIEKNVEYYCQGIFKALEPLVDSNYQAFTNYPVTIDIDKYKKADNAEFVYLTENSLFISVLFSGTESNGPKDFREKMKLLAIGLMKKFGIREKIIVFYYRFYKLASSTEEYSGPELYAWFDEKLREMKDIIETGRFYVDYADI